MRENLGRAQAEDGIDRRKVLRHHPDKKAAGASGTNDDAFFKCIQKGTA